MTNIWFTPNAWPDHAAEKHQRFLTHLRERSREIAPDYPDIDRDLEPWEHLWAISASAEGSRMACDDWYKLMKLVIDRFGLDFDKVYALWDEARGDTKASEHRLQTRLTPGADNR